MKTTLKELIQLDSPILLKTAHYTAVLRKKDCLFKEVDGATRTLLFFEIDFGEVGPPSKSLDTYFVVDYMQQVEVFHDSFVVQVLNERVYQTNIDVRCPELSLTLSVQLPRKQQSKTEAGKKVRQGREVSIMRNLKTEVREAARLLDEYEKDPTSYDNESIILILKVIASQTLQAAGSANYLLGHYHANQLER